MSEPKASQTMSAPGSCFGDQDRRPLEPAQRHREAGVRRVGRLAEPRASGKRFCVLERPVGGYPRHPVRHGDEGGDPVGVGRARAGGRARRPGMPIVAYGASSAVSVRATGPSHRSEPSASRIEMTGAGPKPFWWNVKPATESGSLTRIDLAGGARGRSGRRRGRS